MNTTDPLAASFLELRYTPDDLLEGREDVTVLHLDAWARRVEVPGYLDSRGVPRPILAADVQYTVVAPGFEHLVFVAFHLRTKTARVYDSWPNDDYHDATEVLVRSVAAEIRTTIITIEWPECPKQSDTSRTCGYHVARLMMTVPFGGRVRSVPLPKRVELNEALKAFGVAG